MGKNERIGIFEDISEQWTEGLDKLRTTVKTLPKKNVLMSTLFFLLKVNMKIALYIITKLIVFVDSLDDEDVREDEDESVTGSNDWSSRENRR